MEERAFATIAKDSVKLMAESIGISNLSDDVAALLGEDVNYRLREVVMKSTSFMKSAKRRRLCPEDFNQALRDMNVQPVHGQSSLTDCPVFRQTREGEFHFTEESDVNFSNTVCNSYVPKYLGETSIKAQWMALEGVNRFSSSSHSAAHLQNTSKNIKKESNAEIMAYYSCITRALVGSRPALAKLALTNLSVCKRIQPVLPYFVNFVANGVKVVSHDVAKLTVLMKTVASLVKNPAVFLGMQPYLRLLVQAVETCLLEPQASYMNQQPVDHWMLRHQAAQVLADLVRKWNTPVSRLRLTVVNKLTENLQDLARPLCSHYGAVIGLMALGAAEVETVLVSQLPQLIPHLLARVSGEQAVSQHVRADAIRVLEAVQLALEKLLKCYMDSDDLRDGNSSIQMPQKPSETPLRHNGQQILALYQQVSDSLGDTLSARLPVMDLDKVFPGHPSTEVTSLGDADSKRSGEELLADLMQQVRQEQEEERRRLMQERLAEQQQKSECLLQQQTTLQNEDSELKELIDAAAAASCQAMEVGEGPEHGAGFPEQLAVSSTISDPSKGTLKLKIKRHPQGQGSPSQSRLMLQLNKTWSDAGSPQQSKEHRQKRKRKQASKTPWEQDLCDLSDLEDPLGQSLLSHTPQAYSPGGESSSSESNVYKKGKLMLKLKVPSRDSPSD